MKCLIFCETYEFGDNFNELSRLIFCETYEFGDNFNKM